MANQEHLDILKQGGEVWNEWRGQNPEVVPDLSMANLFEADLSGADLMGADLMGANLSVADLSSANLSGCWVGRTAFVAVDLSGCSGLEDLRAASSIQVDPQTVGISPDLPESFLRLAEWPQEFIDSRSLLQGGVIRFHSVFISYSHEDEVVADVLYRKLRAERIDAFYAPEDLPWGARTREHIIGQIYARSRLLVVLSEKSVASDWVEDEVNTALDKEKRDGSQVLFPIRIDEAALTSDQDWIYHLRKKRNIGDWTRWEDPTEQARLFERMLKELKDV